MSFFNRLRNFASDLASSWNPSKGDAEGAIIAFAMVAAADGELQAEEATNAVAYIESFEWISKYGDHDACETLFMQVTNKICDAPTPTVARMLMKGEAQKLQKLVRKGSDNARTIYELCEEMAKADGKVGDDERQVLALLKTNLGV